MKNKKLAILGGGNIGAALAQGVIKAGLVKAKDIVVTKRNADELGELASLGVTVSSDNISAVSSADIVLVAVQPKQLLGLLKEIKGQLTAKHALVSCVTGVSLSEMREVVGDKVALFRAMPNTAISIQQSITCIATSKVSKAKEKEILTLFNNLGKAVIIEEDLMAAATVLGACGVAYALRFVRAASQGGIEIGFDADIAQLIAAQTVVGAASLLFSTGKHPEREIDKVTTPQGCTIAGLNEMEHQGFSSALIKGLKTSYGKIHDIAEGS